jgi:chloramphenicol-sensitive protein RarD
MNKGTWYAIGAYVAWGLLPVFWRSLEQVGAVQVISHRIFWSALVLIALLIVTRQVRPLRAALSWRVIGIYSLAALLIAANWLLFIWAVNGGHYLETSLGYFLNPLFSVLLGVIFLRERPRPWQWAALGLAAVGVLYLAFAYGALPWIALGLAATFSLYGFSKKMAPLGPLHGLTMETGLLMVPALAYILYLNQIGQGAFLHSGLTIDVLLLATGIITVIPLLMFASASRQIPLSTMGILQYINPTLQFLLGAVVYREPFTAVQFVGFVIIWVALLLFALEGLITRRNTPVVVGAD